MMPAIIFILSLALLVGLGIFLIVGTLKGMKTLVDPPLTWYMLFPYTFLKKIGGKAFYYFHIFIGIIFILSAVFIVFFVLNH